MQIQQQFENDTEWYTDEESNLVGTVVHHNGRNWGYAVLELEDSGKLRVLRSAEHISDHRTAIARLRRAMRVTEDEMGRVDNRPERSNLRN